MKDVFEFQVKIGIKYNVNNEICSEGYIVQYLQYSVNVVIIKYCCIFVRYQGRYLILKFKDKVWFVKYYVGYIDQQ